MIQATNPVTVPAKTFDTWFINTITIRSIPGTLAMDADYTVTLCDPNGQQSQIRRIYEKRNILADPALPQDQIQAAIGAIIAIVEKDMINRGVI